MVRPLAARLTSGVAMAVLLACSDDVTSPSHEQSPERAEILADPAPSAPGIFLGSAVTPTACTDGSQADTDRDGLAESCENALAAAFAPELAYSSTDRATREPRWAARRLGNGKVRVA